MKTSICLIILMIHINLGSFAQTATLPSGAGTVSNPYQIENLNNLYWIAAHYTRWHAHYIQTNNIDAAATADWFGGAGWLPIGGSPIPFDGTYDGQGHTIDSISINRSDNAYHGFFATINEGTISNLKLTNLNIVGHHVGGLVGYAGSTTITNCSTTGSISGDATVGGLVGMINLSTYGYSHNVTECYSTANVICTGDGLGYGPAGGLIGSIDNWGGNYTNLIVSDCWSSGNVQGYMTFGGFAGDCTTAKIERCYSTGNVQGVNTGGGFIGRTDDNTMIKNCYSHGNVTRISSAPVYNHFFAGFMAYNQQSHISFCYSTGSVTYDGASNPTSKGFLGGSNNVIMMMANFYDMGTSGQSGSAYQGWYFGKTTGEMKTISTFTNETWDFIGETTNGTNDYWSLDGVSNGGYPFLSWENSCWTGSSRSSDWFAISNWSTGAVPTSSDIVSIANVSTNPTIGGSTTAECAELIIASGCSVTIQNNGTLTVSGNGN
ncbi:MAG: GLUG motif-containing protein [Bacteroidota bacterium]